MVSWLIDSMSWRFSKHALLLLARRGVNHALRTFRFWYNQVRPHQHLQGRTPHEVWHGIDIYRCRIRRSVEYEAWDGLLRGECLHG